ncbi:Serine/threonine-protein kinase, active site [Sesbania bispinosa]|nr:Serine/threonine-protein kinase, active site [Sesbania bispinosa]
MTVERRFVLVGIRIDSHSRQLLNWALVKVAEPGDCVIAVHVVKNSVYVSKNKSLIDEYLEVYEGLCGVKKVDLTGQILTGNSIRSILVREAKNHAALALVVGGRATIAKYCAKRLPPTTNVLAIKDSRVVFRRCTNKQPPGSLIVDPRPSLTSIESLSERVTQSEFGDSVSMVESEKPTPQNTIDQLKEESFDRLGRSKSRKLIGKGGSNRVYKGVLPDGKLIAVKVLKSSKEALKDFALEVEIVSSLKHKNVVPLLGICIEDNTLISVYDYFPKGSLEENLHGKNKDGSILSWEVRFNVAVGIAEALDYLHREALKPVIHRDVKSSNILLSHGYEPQVSDKIDVYAFGVVLLELISGREPISSEPCKGQESLVVWAKPILESGDIKGLLDPNLEGKFDETQMQRMVLAASLCITRAARIRPKMNEILKILKGDEKIEHFLNSEENDHGYSGNEENIDDEVYPNSSAELHLSLALLGVEDDSTSCSSTDHSFVSEHLKEQWSRSSSFS